MSGLFHCVTVLLLKIEAYLKMLVKLEFKTSVCKLLKYKLV